MVCVGFSLTLLLHSLLLRLSLPFLRPHLNSALLEAMFQFKQGLCSTEAALRVSSTAIVKVWQKQAVESWDEGR